LSCGILDEEEISMKSTKEKRTTLKIEAQRESRMAYIMLFPIVVSFFVFLYMPFVNAIQIGFYKYTGLFGKGDFIGLQNYIAVFKDRFFYGALIHNFQLMIVNICVTLPLGFLLAYALYVGIPGKKIFHIALFIPYLISMVVVGCIWKIVYDPAIGPLNQFLKIIGLDKYALAWLSRRDTAIWATAIAWVWRSTPFNMMVLYANILKMPAELIEAAEIDGAHQGQKIWYVVVPFLGSTFGVLFMLSITHALRLFDIIWVMTQGGPGGATEVMTSYIYRKSFVIQDFGTGTASSLILMVILVGLMGLINLGKWLRKEKSA
jgi:ABC-type sugar transport system permease subunit